MSMPNEMPLEIAKQHVRQAAERVQRQDKLVAKPQADGHSTMEAERFLTCFKMTQRQFKNVVASLRTRNDSAAEPAG
jgi:predicted nucleic acid-binding Zn ribbon protein